MNGSPETPKGELDLDFQKIENNDKEEKIYLCKSFDELFIVLTTVGNIESTNGLSYTPAFLKTYIQSLVDDEQVLADGRILEEKLNKIPSAYGLRKKVKELLITNPKYFTRVK